MGFNYIQVECKERRLVVNEESSLISGESQVNDSIYTDRILVCHLEVAYIISLINERVKVAINLANQRNFPTKK